MSTQYRIRKRYEYWECLGGVMESDWCYMPQRQVQFLGLAVWINMLYGKGCIGSEQAAYVYIEEDKRKRESKETTYIEIP